MKIARNRDAGRVKFNRIGSSARILAPIQLSFSNLIEWRFCDGRILQRMVSESALERPGQGVALSRLTEVLFVEVLRSWIKSLGPGEGGWLGAMADPHIGPALRLIHEQLDRPWSLRDLGLRVGLGRSAFSTRFTKLVGQPMHRYLIAHRMMEAAFLLEAGDEPIARIASRVGYETAAAFSKLFQRHHGLSPGRYRTTHSERGRS